jgi:hypothetical protein
MISDVRPDFGSDKNGRSFAKVSYVELPFIARLSGDTLEGSRARDQPEDYGRQKHKRDEADKAAATLRLR